jgi:hypothetical protein
MSKKLTPEEWKKQRWPGIAVACQVCGSNVRHNTSSYVSTTEVSDFRGDDVVVVRHATCHERTFRTTKGKP